jgi:hypothetical protein
VFTLYIKLSTLAISTLLALTPTLKKRTQPKNVSISLASYKKIYGLPRKIKTSYSYLAGAHSHPSKSVKNK